MNIITFVILFYLSLNIGSMTFARDFERFPPIPWPADKTFDFCPTSKNFDYRNAYWLAAMSYYSYWQPSYLEKIMSVPMGEPVSLDLKSPTGVEEGQITAMGLGWKGHVHFFTSAPITPRSPKVFPDQYTSFFTAPLPYEACVKPEKLWCFGYGPYDSGRRGAEEIKACGINLEKTLMTRDRLTNVSLLAKGEELNSEDSQRARRDYESIQNYVTAFEKTKGVDLGLDFKDPQFVERCEIYHQDDQFTPDAQAIWMETPEMVIIAIRGTEMNNIIDWTTDFTTAFQLNHRYLPFWKRNVHKGFEKSLEVMSHWLHTEINNLFRDHKNASDIPIFVTGHSMGGALAVLVMTDLMERNQKVSPDTRLNLKAVYTFGAPRLGNKSFAEYFQKLHQQSEVGFYRIVNKKDVITKAPCFDYTHFGSTVQFNYPENRALTPEDLQVLVNPTGNAYNYCAYGSQLIDNFYNAKKYAKYHYLESYYSVLSTARTTLIRAFEEERNNRIQTSAPSSGDLQHPNNCNTVPFKKEIKPYYLRFNFQSLPLEIEK